jgi:hypothetical protein
VEIERIDDGEQISNNAGFGSGEEGARDPPRTGPQARLQLKRISNNAGSDSGEEGIRDPRRTGPQALLQGRPTGGGRLHGGGRGAWRRDFQPGAEAAQAVQADTQRSGL